MCVAFHTVRGITSDGVRIFQESDRTVITGCLFSGTIEIMQYITGRGLTEVDDVITNTIGAVVGVVIYKLVSVFYQVYQNNRIIE